MKSTNLRSRSLRSLPWTPDRIFTTTSLRFSFDSVSLFVPSYLCLLPTLLVTPEQPSRSVSKGATVSPLRWWLSYLQYRAPVHPVRYMDANFWVFPLLLGSFVRFTGPGVYLFYHWVGARFAAVEAWFSKNILLFSLDHHLNCFTK